MAAQKPPQAIPFGGLLTRGSPVARPPQSSIRCQDFRLMPGVPGKLPYLRNRGGKTFRMTNAGGQYLKFYEWTGQTYGTANIALYNTDGGLGKWKKVDMTTQPYTNADIYIMPGSPSTQESLVGVRNKVFFTNGWHGVRDGATSKPPLSSWDGTTIRFVGLDAYCPSGTYPTAAMTLGAGNNNIIYWVDIWVGLFNSTTQHYSNAVYAGRVATPGAGTINVTNLTRLTHVSNNGTEEAELKYVFYASIDGGETAYLVLNSALTAPFQVAVATASASLSIGTLSPQGFVLDLTQERPIENTPPRYPTYMSYANGRVYGAFSGLSAGVAANKQLPGPRGTFYPDFDYPTGSKGSGFIGWSASADDQTSSDFVGIPEESWPTKNRKYTPKGENPIIVEGIEGTSMVLVLTNLGSYVLYEAADGLHQWVTVNPTDGITGNGESFVLTPRGPVWITQRLQLVMYDLLTNKLTYLSTDFDEYLSAPVYGGQISTADYIRDPHQQLDYYEAWLPNSSHSSVVYDFSLGMASTKTSGAIVRTARSMRDANGATHHVLALANDGPLLTQETDPITGLIPTRDELTSGVFTEISGDYITQWMCFDDPRLRKSLSDIDLIGDGELTQVLGPGIPLAVSCWMDFDDSEEIPLSLEKTLQSNNDCDHNYKARARDLNFFWIKLRFRLTGHGSDQTTYAQGSSSNGEVPPNFYGCIYDAAITQPLTANRP